MSKRKNDGPSDQRYKAEARGTKNLARRHARYLRGVAKKSAKLKARGLLGFAARRAAKGAAHDARTMRGNAT